MKIFFVFYQAGLLVLEGYFEITRLFAEYSQQLSYRH